MHASAGVSPVFEAPLLELPPLATAPPNAPAVPAPLLLPPPATPPELWLALPLAPPIATVRLLLVFPQALSQTALAPAANNTLSLNRRTDIFPTTRVAAPSSTTACTGRFSERNWSVAYQQRSSS
jgi:hypothetical protein